MESNFVNQPDNTYILETNSDSPNTVNVVFPQSGKLWIAYEFSGSSPNSDVYIQHQGGKTTPVELGFNTYEIGQGDMLVYSLQNDMIMIKLGWAYV